MKKLTRADLMSLEQYASERTRLRSEVIAHKRIRNVQVGPNMTWCFEDYTTIRYQVLEMLRAERIFEGGGIQGELDAYNPLIPDGSNWKVTLLLEYPDSNERRTALENLIGVEDRCWIRVSEMERVFAIADEDMDRTNDEKTSAVHFLRFELSPSMVEAMKSGATLSVGVDHDNYRHLLSPLPPPIRDSLSGDLT
ncbi:MAG: hypothetical protein QOF32_269 [Gammaproteobacteria bacterium]|nr:hypothetical protein [Gammaproteobacteria bacterium]